MSDLQAAWLNRFSDNTADGYRRDLNQFASWLRHTTGKTDLLATERIDVQNWIKHLRTRKHLTDPTIRRKASAVSSFFEYAAEEDTIPHNPARHTRRPKGETAIKLGLSTDDARRLVATARNHSPAAYALVLLMITSGLRISEAVGINTDDITTNHGRDVVHVTRKGGSRSYVRIAPTVREAVLTASNNREEGPIFLGPRQRRLSRRRAGTLLTQLGHTAGIQHVTPHLLRHTAATQAILNGTPIEDVQQLLGHRSIDTTRRYIRAIDNNDRSPVDQLTDLFTSG
jgi:site-specific recombinase XerD